MNLSRKREKEKKRKIFCIKYRFLQFFGFLGYVTIEQFGWKATFQH